MYYNGPGHAADVCWKYSAYNGVFILLAKVPWVWPLRGGFVAVMLLNTSFFLVINKLVSFFITCNSVR